MALPFRHSDGFGMKMEYWIIGRMLKEGLDIYVPLVGDDAIDAVVRRENVSFITVQIKARYKDVVPGHLGLCSRLAKHQGNHQSYIARVERDPLILEKPDFL